MEGHIQIINDPAMGMEIENLIKAGTCAEAAVEQMLDMFINIFSMTDDDLTRQRASDLKDIKRALLSHPAGHQRGQDLRRARRHRAGREGGHPLHDRGHQQG